MFDCRLCSLSFDSVTAYWIHCSRIHSGIPKARFPCGVRNCLSATFSSLSAIRQHVTRCHMSERRDIRHSSYASGTVDLRCIEGEVTCSGISINSVTSLISHLKEHIRKGETIRCPYKHSGIGIHNESTFKSHLSRNHRNASPLNLCDIYFQPFTDCQITGPQTEDNLDSETEHSLISTINVENPAILSEAVEKKLALLYLKLQTKHHVTKTVIQTLVDELKTVNDLNQEILQSALRSTLVNQGLNLSEDKIGLIIKETCDSDSFLRCHGSKDSVLRSNYSRQKYYKEHFRFVAPVELYLGLNSKNKPSFCHYIPIVETLQTIFHDETVKHQYLNPETRPANCLYDYLDGNVFKSNDLFNEEPSSLKIILYQDSFEVVNPLGSAKKKHKALAIYFILGNLHSYCRSQIDPVQLVLLCKELDFNYFGHDTVLGALINDLRRLEDGIEIPALNSTKKIRGTVLFIAGDNLGSHCIGGFVENFSSAHYKCRYCLVTSEQLGQADSCLLGKKRDIDSYKRSVTEVQNNPQLVSFQGVKFDSLFNRLRYFHVCSPGLPPCLAHDLFEGVLHYDLALYFTYFITENKWFSWEYLSRKFSTFKLLGDDNRDKPNANDIKKGDKIGGQAQQTWCMLRFTPLVIGCRIEDTQDPVWQNVLLLQKLVQLILAPKISREQVALLRVYIEQYIDVRVSQFSENSLKPKHHYLCHYPELILHFGSLVHVWTMRFESKHSYFKKCARHSQNFCNITKTLAHRHQLLQAYYSAGNLFGEEVESSDKVPFHKDLYNEKIKDAVKNIPLISGADTSVVNRVTVRGTEYKKDTILVLQEVDNSLVLGKILLILITHDKTVHFMVKQCVGKYVPDMNFYEICDVTDSCIEEFSFQLADVACVEFSSLDNTSCLQSYKVGDKAVIVLKHAIISTD